MKGTSKVVMGATLVMVVSLAMVLGLILVLLAELYCSLLLRRRQLRITTTNTTTTSAMVTDPSAAEATGNSSSSQPQDQSSDPPHPPLPSTPPLSSFYSQGVLKAPRSLLFPVISLKEDSLTATQTKRPLSQLHHQVIDIPNPKQEPNSSPSSSISLAVSPKPTTQENKAGSGNVTTSTTTGACNDKACDVVQEHFMYISNPIYDNGESRVSGVNTPFETPDTSPSRLEMSGSGSSGEDDEVGQPLPTSRSSPLTPPLTPMKKLPAEACSVSLRDARCLGTSGSDSNTNNGLSSSSSGSPCTSPSW